MCVADGTSTDRTELSWLSVVIAFEISRCRRSPRLCLASSKLPCFFLIPSPFHMYERRRCRSFELVIATETLSAQLPVPVPVEYEGFTDALIPSKSAVDSGGWFEGMTWTREREEERGPEPYRPPSCIDESTSLNPGLYMHSYYALFEQSIAI
jgi:hypothetical protein